MTDSKVTNKDRPDSYFIQIGFDFGTSYSKCICRDVMTNNAWVYVPSRSDNVEDPYLIPSTILMNNGLLSYQGQSSIEYHQNGLHHLKLALKNIALEQWYDPVLIPYKEANGGSCDELFTFGRACGVYFLAGELGNIRKEIRKKFPNFGTHKQDYMAVNIAVPVADAEQPNVYKYYHEITQNAWKLADQLAGHPKISFKEICELINEEKEAKYEDIKEDCFIYPEVSANVQGFVRSRVSSEGIYLFSDTGGGSVDQSIFIFLHKYGKELLTYLNGSVLPMGSGKIEYLAAKASGKTDWQTLELWRQRKELGEDHNEIRRAREGIADQLERGTRKSLALAKNKLFVKEQLNDIRVIFGGGGHCDHPYARAVINTFSGDLFPHNISPDIIGMPIPRDIDLGENGSRWMRRLSVAYGLSFIKGELAKFTFPCDVSEPQPNEIWKHVKDLPDIPTKDVC